MCTGFEPWMGTAISAAMSGAGMLMQQSAASDAADKQQNIINQAQEESAKQNTKKANTIQNFATNTYDPTARDAKYETAATNNESSLVDSLLNAKGTAGEIEQGAEGRLSDDYTRAKATATASATDDILKRAKLMARNNASSLMYGKEQLAGGQLNSDIGLINGSMQRADNATKTALGRVDNSGSLAGGLLTGLAGTAGGMLNKKLGN